MDNCFEESSAVLDCEEIVENSQQQTQSTQQASQPCNSGSNYEYHLWGYLQPCSPGLLRIDFHKVNMKYNVGRNSEANEVVLPGMKISNHHCIIAWDGSEGNGSVVVTDLSSNGTFINNVKIGRGKNRALKDGNEIAFGTCVPQPLNNGVEDYRFIYRHMAEGPPTTGFHAHYDITTELGKGSFAVVMKAVCRTTGKFYAVKMIQESRQFRHSGDNQNTKSRKDMFTREISVLQSLNHRNICQLKEVFYEEGGDINLVLELVDGGDLLEYILKKGGLNEDETRHITYQLCDALAHIHSKHVTHRDLKPENVLLTKDVPPIVKVADFGLAKYVDSLTMLRTMCGTPSYLAPEVAAKRPDEAYNSVVDSWSVGVIVFSMVTNSSPFIEDPDQRDICIRIIERVVDWECLKSARVSKDAENFIRALLIEDPSRRLKMQDALRHPWFRNFTPYYGSSSCDNNIMNEGLQNLHIKESIIQASMDPRDSTNGILREGSRILQRRSHLLSQAQEDGIDIPEPSQQMVEHVTAAGTSKVQKKRVHSELTPVSEEENAADTIGNGESLSPLSEVDSLYKRDSGDEAGKDASKFGPERKSKVTASSSRRTGRSRVNKSDEANEEVGTSAQPRRSGRKAARHC